MKRSHLWKLLLILFAVFWAATEIYPPQARNLIDQFDKTAVLNPDPSLNEVIKRAKELDAMQAGKKYSPTLTYSNLLAAIGTNDIRRHFPTNYIPRESGLAPTAAILNRLQRESAGKFKLGIDLQGGTQFMLEIDSEKAATNNMRQTLGASAFIEQAIEVLRKRVDAMGVAEPIIQPAGANRILVQLPGLTASATAEARANIQRAAYLEFHMVHPQSREHLANGRIPPGYERKVIRGKAGPNGQPGQDETVLIKRGSERGMGGTHIERTSVIHNQMTGEPEINFTLTSEGTKLFGEVTTAHVGERLGIVLDGEVISAPNINTPITGGSGQITGRFTEKEANDLAAALDNPLAAPLHVMEERSVDPSLGADSVTSGLKSAVFGILAVGLFMLVYYLFAGLVANIALMVNMLLLLGVMCSLDVTFTLPGIAGIVLTVGMAVDANVLIYERIREELAAGKSVRGAVAAGYSKAFGTIFDSHLTTLISSVLLIILGTGPVKGFGVALTVGIFLSLFTALIVTRLIFDTWLETGERKSVPMLHLIRGTKIDFLKWALPAFVTSWTIIILGIGYGVIVRGHNLLGVEFAGGDTVTMRFESAAKPGVDEIRRTVESLKIGDSAIQYQSEGAKEYLRVTVSHAADATRGAKPGAALESSNGLKAEQALLKAFPNAKFERVQLDTVGPTIGFEIQKAAILASLLSLFGILIYVAFRYEFSFAVGAVVAVLHDVLMTIGIYCLTGLFHDGNLGRQFNATFIAAILTIIGFSINDTIVIFDRIREDLKLGKRGTFREIMNTALNETLSRTIITSGTVFLATIILFLFGGGPINDFAFTFLVGILTGTYSSIYIASALVLWWHKGERPKLGTNPTTLSGVIEVESTPKGA